MSRYTLMSMLLGALVLPVLAGTRPDSAKQHPAFSHRKHVEEAGVACTDCHALPEKKAGPVAFPALETCRQCHEEALTIPVSPALYYPDFSHSRHRDRNLDCASCHGNLEGIDAGYPKNIPAMDGCLKCHNDKTAPSGCRLCHQNLEKVKPASHTRPGFQGKGHGRDARFARLDCDRCHQGNSCERCHRGLDKRPVHRPNFEFYHGKEAKKRDRNCATCHESEAFCAACHTGRRR